jgi:phytol kinase
MMMCGGDGIADIIGRQVKSPKLSWSREKSIAGMLGVFVGGWLMSVSIIFIYILAGVFPAPITNYLLPITIIAFAGALIESLHFKDIDNITMTLASVLIGTLFF